MQRFHRFRYVLSILALPLAAVSYGQEAADSDTGDTPNAESMAAYLLKDLNEREQSAYKRYEKALATEDVHSIETELQSIVDGYEALISAAPNYAAAFISYGMMLHRIGERIPSNAMLIRADQIDPYHAIVKNQLGNYQAEEGYRKPWRFTKWPSTLGPTNLSTTTNWETSSLATGSSLSMINSSSRRGSTWKFRIDFEKQPCSRPRICPTVSATPKVFDIARPNWEAALEEWQQLVNFVESPEEKQMMQLYMAKTRFEMGHHTAARKIINGIDDPSLATPRVFFSNRSTPSIPGKPTHTGANENGSPKIHYGWIDCAY